MPDREIGKSENQVIGKNTQGDALCYLLTPLQGWGTSPEGAISL